MLTERELAATRSIRQKDLLSRFFRTQSRWELLLMIATNRETEETGIWSYIEMMETRTESPMTIYHFIRDRIDDGSFLLMSGQKKSRKILALSPQLEAALTDFLTQRYIVGPIQHNGLRADVLSSARVVNVTTVPMPVTHGPQLKVNFQDTTWKTAV